MLYEKPVFIKLNIISESDIEYLMKLTNENKEVETKLNILLSDYQKKNDILADNEDGIIKTFIKTVGKDSKYINELLKKKPK